MGIIDDDWYMYLGAWSNKASHKQAEQFDKKKVWNFWNFKREHRLKVWKSDHFNAWKAKM